MRGFDKGGIDRQTRCLSHVQCPCWLSECSDTHLILKLSQSVVDAFSFFGFLDFLFSLGTSNNIHIYKEILHCKFVINLWGVQTPTCMYTVDQASNEGWPTLEGCGHSSPFCIKAENWIPLLFVWDPLKGVMGEAHDVDLLSNLILQSAVWAEILSTACPVKEIMGTYYFRYCPLVGTPPCGLPPFGKSLLGAITSHLLHLELLPSWLSFVAALPPYQVCALSGGTAHEKKICGLEAIAQEYPR